jgi:hypothetical protein
MEWECESEWAPLDARTSMMEVQRTWHEMKLELPVAEALCSRRCGLASAEAQFKASRLGSRSKLAGHYHTRRARGPKGTRGYSFDERSRPGRNTLIQPRKRPSAH